MKPTTKFAIVHTVTSEESGEVTMYLGNEPWGPIVTGKNLAEAKTKLKEAFGLAMIANSYCDTLRQPVDDKKIREELIKHKEEYAKLENTLQTVL
jgi:hypothetical protein